MLKLHHFRDFVAIAEARSIRGAARVLGLAQLYLSRSLGELKHELGLALLKRHAAGVELTLAGEQFLILARSGLGEFQPGIEEMEDSGKEVGGQVFIAISSPPFLPCCPRIPDLSQALSKNSPASDDGYVSLRRTHAARWPSGLLHRRRGQEDRLEGFSVRCAVP